MMTALAFPLPVTVIGELVGVPESRRGTPSRPGTTKLGDACSGSALHL